MKTTNRSTPKKTIMMVLWQLCLLVSTAAALLDTRHPLVESSEKINPKAHQEEDPSIGKRKGTNPPSSAVLHIHDAGGLDHSEKFLLGRFQHLPKSATYSTRSKRHVLQTTLSRTSQHELQVVVMMAEGTTNLHYEDLSWVVVNDNTETILAESETTTVSEGKKDSAISTIMVPQGWYWFEWTDSSGHDTDADDLYYRIHLVLDGNTILESDSQDTDVTNRKVYFRVPSQVSPPTDTSPIASPSSTPITDPTRRDLPQFTEGNQTLVVTLPVMTVGFQLYASSLALPENESDGVRLLLTNYVQEMLGRDQDYVIVDLSSAISYTATDGSGMVVITGTWEGPVQHAPSRETIRKSFAIWGVHDMYRILEEKMGLHMARIIVLVDREAVQPLQDPTVPDASSIASEQIDSNNRKPSVALIFGLVTVIVAMSISIVLVKRATVMTTKDWPSLLPNRLQSMVVCSSVSQVQAATPPDKGRTSVPTTPAGRHPTQWGCHDDPQEVSSFDNTRTGYIPPMHARRLTEKIKKTVSSNNIFRTRNLPFVSRSLVPVTIISMLKKGHSSYYDDDDSELSVSVTGEVVVVSSHAPGVGADGDVLAVHSDGKGRQRQQKVEEMAPVSVLPAMEDDYSDDDLLVPAATSSSDFSYIEK